MNNACIIPFFHSFRHKHTLGALHLSISDLFLCTLASPSTQALLYNFLPCSFHFTLRRKFTIPQRFFLHFYAVASLWTMLLLVATWVYAYRMVPLVAEPFPYSTITSYLTGGSAIRTGSSKLRQSYVAWQTVFLLLLMEIQVLRCLYETIQVFNYSPSARMHILGYLTGLFATVAVW